MAGGYIIQVGNESPAEAIIATPNKKTGEPVGPQMKTFIRVGNHLIINRARVWGRRVIDGKPRADKSDIEFNTPGYKGEIEFLTWGTAGGYAIDIRYLPQSKSLDFEYQQNIQRIVINQDQESAHIALSAGQNKFDLVKDELKIAFLKVYPMNRDSKSKNPDPAIKSSVYYEVTESDLDSSSVKGIEKSLDAALIVKEISNNPEEVRNLFSILAPREEFGKVDLLSLDGQIYRTLLEYAAGYSDDFLSLIDSYKKTVVDDFEKAKSYKALDLTKNGHIGIEVEGKKQVIISDLKGKGEEMVDYMVSNYLKEDVYKATQILKELVSKLK